MERSENSCRNAAIHDFPSENQFIFSCGQSHAKWRESVLCRDRRNAQRSCAAVRSGCTSRTAEDVGPYRYNNIFAHRQPDEMAEKCTAVWSRTASRVLRSPSSRRIHGTAREKGPLPYREHISRRHVRLSAHEKKSIAVGSRTAPRVLRATSSGKSFTSVGSRTAPRVLRPWSSRE